MEGALKTFAYRLARQGPPQADPSEIHKYGAITPRTSTVRKRHLRERDVEHALCCLAIKGCPLGQPASGCGAESCVPVLSRSSQEFKTLGRSGRSCSQRLGTVLAASRLKDGVRTPGRGPPGSPQSLVDSVDEFGSEAIVSQAGKTSQASDGGGEVAEVCVGLDLAFVFESVDGCVHLGGVPVDDGVRDDVETESLVGLVFGLAVPALTRLQTLHRSLAP